MLKNYIKIALRNIKKNRGISFINIAGLAIGMAVCILILLYVRSELSFDAFHEHSDRVYRIQRSFIAPDGSERMAFSTLAPSFVPLLEENFPEIERAVRMWGNGNHTVTIEDRNYIESRFFYAEEDIFKVFTLPLLKGDSDTALKNPHSVVLSRSMSEKFFGDEDPIGKSLKVDNNFLCTVTGVMEDSPQNTHLHIDILGSYTSLLGSFGSGENDYFHGSRNFSDNVTLVYALLVEGTDIQVLTSKIPDFLDRTSPPRTDRDGNVVRMSQVSNLVFQKMKDIHLRSHTSKEFEPNSDIKYVVFFTIIAFFILIIACINFMNLSTAQAVKRAKEVGLRKVVGANRRLLASQFLGESFIITLIAMASALTLVFITRPWFNAFSGNTLSLDILATPVGLLSLLGVFLITGFVSGLYPSLFISAFHPASILRGEVSKGRKGTAFRRILVIFQFAISIILIFSVTVVSKQMHYIQNVDLGYDRENIVLFRVDQLILNHWQDIKSALKQNPRILHTSLSKRAPTGQLLDSPGFRTEVYGEVVASKFRMPHNRVEHDFFKTYGMQIIAGRDFSIDFPTDARQAYILNETAASQLGWKKAEDAVGSTIQGIGHPKGTVIGVVRNFNYESLHKEIIPILSYILPTQANTLSVRLAPGNARKNIEFIQGTLKQFHPGLPMEYEFLQSRINQLYRNEDRMLKMFGYFSILAIIIGCLGLFGLAAFASEQRTKEIGIRKILGASVSGITLRLTLDFTKWILVANIIAWPIAFFTMNAWLKNFAYRTFIGWDPFILSGVTAFIIAVLTVCYQTIRSAVTDPVAALRYE
ncbi:ABC transporter permease [Acidobacteriota bacterium]